MKPFYFLFQRTKRLRHQDLKLNHYLWLRLVGTAADQAALKRARDEIDGLYHIHSERLRFNWGKFTYRGLLEKLKKNQQKYFFYKNDGGDKQK